MALYALADFAAQLADDEAAVRWRKAAATASPDYCFPSRLEEMLILERALCDDPLDAKGHYYLGNLYYDRKRYEDAIRNWEGSVDLDPAFSIPSRNLGIAYFNIRHDAPRALNSYERARHANPHDAPLLYQEDHLRKRMRFTAKERLAILEPQAPSLGRLRRVVFRTICVRASIARHRCPGQK
jgi:tetratricopeptide (TPR) repeat protein